MLPQRSPQKSTKCIIDTIGSDDVGNEREMAVAGAVMLMPLVPLWFNAELLSCTVPSVFET
jgi:hypothetical protein